MKTFEKYEGCPQSITLIQSTNADNKMFIGSTVCKNYIPVIVYISNIMQNRISILFSLFFWGGGRQGADW